VKEPEHLMEENKAALKIAEEVKPVEEKIEATIESRVEEKEQHKSETPKDIVKIEDIQI
jgi:hypothetical protein